MPDPSDVPMIAQREASAISRRPEALRWGLCLALALTFHAAGAWAILSSYTAPEDVASAPLILIELAPVAVAQDVAPNRLPPGPQQAEEQPESEPPKPVDKVEPRSEVAKNAELPVTTQTTSPEKPKEAKHEQKRLRSATSPSTADQRSIRAMAQAPGAPSHNPDALPSWKSALVARLEQYKRYPPEAQSRGEHGIAQLAFSIDRSGGVHHPHIVRSSGSNALDRETVALAERAAPMPAPPSDIPGAQIPIVVPIRYNPR
jgi:periplasmic protein TonB